MHLPKPYLLIVTNLYCNHKCLYCIQQKSSLDIRANSKKINVDAVLKFLKRNRIAGSASVLGGEATLHPDFDRLIEGLLFLYRKVIITTNLNGKWFENFPETLRKMKNWGRGIKWNTTYHPAWMEPDVYIKRIREMRNAGIKVDQVATPDTDELSPEVAEKLSMANIGWKLQPFTGKDGKGVMRPRTWDDINRLYQLAFDPEKYITHYDEYSKECEDAGYEGNNKRNVAVECISRRFLIGPDNMVYPCHRHLYRADQNYACGLIEDEGMKNFRFKWSRIFKRWKIKCDAKCNPCDFREVEIRKLYKTGKVFVDG